MAFLAQVAARLLCLWRRPPAASSAMAPGHPRRGLKVWIMPQTLHGTAIYADQLGWSGGAIYRHIHGASGMCYITGRCKPSGWRADQKIKTTHWKACSGPAASRVDGTIPQVRWCRRTLTSKTSWGLGVPVPHVSNL